MFVENSAKDSSQFDLIVPVYNEEAGLPEFFNRLQALKLNCQPIFIDNASEDNSLAMLKEYPNALVIEHPINTGYGGSLISGMEAGNNEHIVIIDADCEYPPECIPELEKSLERYDFVHTSRFLNKSAAQLSNMPLLKKAGNRMISNAFNRLFDQQTTDLYTGCKALKRACLDRFNLQQKGFEHVLELAAKMVAAGYDIDEIAVDFRPRQTGHSKMLHASETVKYFRLLLRYARQFRAGKLLRP